MWMLWQLKISYYFQNVCRIQKLTDFSELSSYLIGWTIRNMRSKYENASDEFSPSRFYEKQMAFLYVWPMMWNGRTSKSQRICRGNLMFYTNALWAVYFNIENVIHLFRRLELRNDSSRQDDKARQCDSQNSGRRHVEKWKSSSSGWRIRFYQVSRNRIGVSSIEELIIRMKKLISLSTMK